MIGAGPAGALTAAALLDRFSLRGYLAEIVLIDPEETTGRGTAFSTPDRRHVLNVTAGKMSAHPDDPGDFLRWITKRIGRQVNAEEYVPRAEFGQYLAEFLMQTEARCARLATLHRVQDRAVSMNRCDRGFTVDLESGARAHVDAVVLALGTFKPGRAWLDGVGPDLSVIVHDPWKPGALSWIPPEQNVLLVGTGLTAVDVALSLGDSGRVIHAVSRRGVLPQHHVGGFVPYPAPEVPARPKLDGLRAAVLRHIALCQRELGDWRPGFDSLRPVTDALWSALSEPEQKRFLRDYRHLWDAHRHRMPPAVWRSLKRLRDSGQFILHKGTVAHVEESGRGVRATLSSQDKFDVAAVINCTGPQSDLREVDEPLVSQLLADELATVGPCGIGFDTTGTGRVLPGQKWQRNPVWTLGATRMGNLLESSAIPEIRQQAVDVAESVTAWVCPGQAGSPRDEKASVVRLANE